MADLQKLFAEAAREERDYMHITFNHTPSSNVDKVTTSHQTAASAYKKAESGYASDISGTVTDNTAYGFYGSRNVQGRTAEELMQAAGSEDIALYRNYMAVMSNSMSDEDFAKLQKEGYNPTDMDIETVVTIMDTIKAELIKAGIDIKGYTDNIDMEQLAKITGSVAFAKQLVKAFSAENIPMTQENVEQSMEALDRGKELTEMSDGTMKYMVDNAMEPDIDNLYLAEHAGAVDANRQGKGYFAEDLFGYYTQKATDAPIEKLQNQIEKVIEKAGYPITEETLQSGFWLIEKGVPLTKESFRLLEELKRVKLPATEEELLSSIAGALAEGRPAGKANLRERGSIYRKAADCYRAYEEKYRAVFSMEITPESIKARRQLEEIRLHMTIEANVKLLKSGFAIDTAPMEEMIDALKDLEEKQTGTDITLANPADICKETLDKTKEILHLPAPALGRILQLGETFTVRNVYETGKAMQEVFRQAGEAYETMMTSPRADMGDSIKTAFRNVDALLEEMGMELNDENRKAVRSLSYNHMELTPDNLLAIKEAARVVQKVVGKMTPDAVLAMIREGINPLQTSMEELETYLSERDSYSEESTKYSRFLYHMEQNKEITADEKESYIGIYRLLRQIEKSDGAVIGNLVNSQAEINFQNLLSAIRTGKVRGVDITVDENIGGLKDAVEKGVNIDTQIETAYSQALLSEIRSVSQVDNEAIHLLKHLNEPVTIDNLLAANAIQTDGASLFKKLAEARDGKRKQQKTDHIQTQTEANSNLDHILDSFTDRESMQQAYGELLAGEEAFAKDLTFGEGMGSLDVRAMQLLCKQLHIMGAAALRDEEYDLPQMIDGELTAIHLTFKHNSGESGKVSVRMDTSIYGNLSGEFSVKERIVSGYFVGKGKEAKSVLENTSKAFEGRLQSAGLEANQIRVIEGITGEVSGMSGGAMEETKQLYELAGMVIGALKETLTQAAKDKAI